MSGIVPAKIAASFTMAELAVLTVIAGQCQRSGVCVLHVDAIAALAGCCRRTVQTARRHAQQLGLILVKERRRPGLPSFTNIVRIISKEWNSWLRLGGGGGCRDLCPTNNHFHSKGKSQETRRGLTASGLELTTGAELSIMTSTPCPRSIGGGTQFREPERCSVNRRTPR